MGVGVDVQMHVFLTSALVEENWLLALLSGKGSPVPTGQEAGWAQEQSRRLGEEEKFLFLRELQI
jgi:hypothetical protein